MNLGENLLNLRFMTCRFCNRHSKNSFVVEVDVCVGVCCYDVFVFARQVIQMNEHSVTTCFWVFAKRI